MNASTHTEHEVDFSTPDQSEVATLNDMKAADTVRISLPQPEAQRMYATEKIVFLSERIAAARAQTGKKILRLFDISEIPQLQKYLSPTELRREHWQIVTNNEKVKHILRTTSLFFSEGLEPHDQLHVPPMKAVSGDMDELENRVARMRPNEELLIRLPVPGTGAMDLQKLRSLQEGMDGRLVFVAHKHHKPLEYGFAPLNIREYERHPIMETIRPDMQKTQEWPVLNIQPPQEIRKQAFPSLLARAKSGVLSLGKKLSSWWKNK